jgi:uncharacterized membrane protein (UPF0136 family)
MKATAVIVCIYGLLIALGGIMGFVQSGSTISLISGSSFGVALLLCSYLIAKGKSAARYAALVLTFLLDAIFTFRFTKTLHFMPAGLLSILSLVVLIVITLQIRKNSKF